jgi:hypothetical protein
MCDGIVTWLESYTLCFFPFSIGNTLGLWLWFLSTLSTIFLLYHMVVCFIDGGN